MGIRCWTHVQKKGVGKAKDEKNQWAKNPHGLHSPLFFFTFQRYLREMRIFYKNSRRILTIILVIDYIKIRQTIKKNWLWCIKYFRYQLTDLQPEIGKIFCIWWYFQKNKKVYSFKKKKKTIHQFIISLTIFTQMFLTRIWTSSLLLKKTLYINI